MEHAREIELIEMVAQRLDAERREVLLAHLRDCPACRTRLEDIERTWDLLGAWDVQPARRIEVAALAASSESRQEGSARSIVRFRGVGTAVRIAAAITVVGLAGYASGRWSVPVTPAGSESEPPQYVSVLGLDLGDSLSPLVLPDGTPSGQEG